MTKPLTPAKLRKALMQIDLEIASMRIIENQFTLAFGYTTPQVEQITDAWNAVHDAIEALEGHRKQVELNRGELNGTELLIAQNID